jgi:hypothetical protein
VGLKSLWKKFRDGLLWLIGAALAVFVLLLIGASGYQAFNFFGLSVLESVCGIAGFVVLCITIGHFTD